MMQIIIMMMRLVVYVMMMCLDGLSWRLDDDCTAAPRLRTIAEICRVRERLESDSPRWNSLSHNRLLLIGCHNISQEVEKMTMKSQK